MVEQTEADSGVVSLLSLPTEILLCIIHLAAASPSSPILVDTPTLVRIAQTCSRLRTAVIAHFFEFEHSRWRGNGFDVGLSSTLRAHAISHAWATGQINHDPWLRLSSKNINLPNGFGQQPTAVRPTVIRLPALKSSANLREDRGGDVAGDVHLLLLFRAQALYWAKPRGLSKEGFRRDGSIHDEARWKPDDATGLNVIGRPAAPPEQGPKKSTRSSYHGSRGKSKHPQTGVPSSESLGRIANLSLDPNCRIGFELGSNNPWQDITAAIVVPLPSADGSITLAIGRRNGTLQLATLIPPSTSSIKAGSSKTSGMLILHPVLPFGFSDDVQALHAVKLPRETSTSTGSGTPSQHRSSYALLAAGSRSGRIVIIRISASSASIRAHANGHASQGSTLNDQSSTVADPTTRQAWTSSTGESKPASDTRPQGKKLPVSNGRATSNPSELSSMQRESHDREAGADPRTQAQAGPTLWTATMQTATSNTVLDAHLLVHRDLLDDLPDPDDNEPEQKVYSREGPKTVGRSMPVWALRFVGDFSSSSAIASSAWLAVGRTSHQPGVMYPLELRLATPTQGEGKARTGDAPFKTVIIPSPPIRLPHPSYLPKDPSEESPKPHSSSPDSPRKRIKSSVYALFSVPIPPSVQAMWVKSGGAVQQDLANGGTTSYLPFTLLSILLVAYDTQPVALFAVGCRNVDDIDEDGSERGTGRSRRMKPRFLLQLDALEHVGPVYSLRAFWHLPTIKSSTAIAQKDTQIPSRSTAGGTASTPILRVLVGSSRHGSVLVWEVSGQELVDILSRGGGTEEDGSSCAGMTLFPSSPWSSLGDERSENTQRANGTLGQGTQDSNQQRTARKAPGLRNTNASSARPRPTTKELGTTYSLALDIDDGCGLEYDSSDSHSNQTEPSDCQGLVSIGANAGARVWGTNGWGLWMMDFVPPLGSNARARLKDNDAEKSDGSGDIARGEDKHEAAEIAFSVNDRLRTDFRLSVDPWA
ncbi:hypothetical protein CF319_g3887 [Tilletia indica]|nr:hypothetical protein CF319_g3887 [Tilletia indica]